MRLNPPDLLNLARDVARDLKRIEKNVRTSQATADSAVVAAAAASASVSGGETVYELDFASLTSQALSDGSVTIDGKTWTVANSAAADTAWDLTRGTGLEYEAAATATEFGGGTSSAARIGISLGDLLDFTPFTDYAFEIAIASFSGTAANDEVAIGLWSTTHSLDRFLAAGVSRGSAARMSLGKVATTQTETATGDYATYDAQAMLVLKGGAAASWWCGDMGGDGFTWPADDEWADHSRVVAATSPSLNTQLHKDAVLAVYFRNGGTAGTHASAVRGIRVRRF